MADTLGTPFFLPRQAFFRNETSSGLSVTQARAQLYFYRTATATGRKAYKAADCENPHPNPVRADASGGLPPIFLDPDSSHEYTAQLDFLLDQDGATTLTEFDIDSIPRYQENFFTASVSGLTYTGFSSGPTEGAGAYFRFGRLVNLVLPSISGTSNATTFTAASGSLPTDIRPSATRYCHLPYATDSGSHLVGGAVVAIASNGAIEFAPADAAYSGTGWTNTGTKGIAAQNGVWYMM